jgi:hypothetical protein
VSFEVLGGRCDLAPVTKHTKALHKVHDGN